MDNKQHVVIATSGKATASLVLGLLSFCFAILTAVPAIILGALALGDINRSQGKLGGSGLAVVGLVLGSIGVPWTCICAALLLPAVQAAREAARRQVTANQLKEIGAALHDNQSEMAGNNLMQIGLALHNYHDTHQSFPLAGSSDPEFGIGYSWRVRLLPYLNELPLYQQFDHDKPWDDPNNQNLLTRMPPAYKSKHRPIEDSKTVYLGVVGPDDQHPLYEQGYQGVFPSDPRNGPKLRDMLDGTANTIMIVEADSDQAKTWMAPEDWQFDPNQPRRGLGNLQPGGFTGLMADGSVRFFSNDIDDETIRRLLSRRDGKPVDF